MNRKNLNSIVRFLAYTLTVVFFLAGCGDSTNVDNSNTGQPQVPTISLTANPSTISQNGSTSLNWSSTDATSCTASGDWSGTKDLSGSETINGLQTDSTFYLSCTGDGGTSSSSVTVSVEVPATARVSLIANPATVTLNGSTILSWQSSNTDSCIASGDWSGSKPASGEEVINSLTQNSLFLLSCTGQHGTAQDSISVTVAIPEVTVNLEANPSTVSLNGSTTLSWQTNNADSCTASGDWSGSKNLSGSETIDSLTTDSHFVLSCSNSERSASDSIDVTISANENGTALLSWTPPTENTDGSALTDLAGYRIYFGTASNSYTETVSIDNPGLTSYQIDNLTAGDWYFAITAVNSSDIESSHSDEVSKTIP